MALLGQKSTNEDGYSELDALKAKLEDLKQKEKCEELKDQIAAKEHDLKYRGIKKLWNNLTKK